MGDGGVGEEAGGGGAGIGIREDQLLYDLDCAWSRSHFSSVL